MLQSEHLFISNYQVNRYKMGYANNNNNNNVRYQSAEEGRKQKISLTDLHFGVNLIGVTPVYIFCS